MLRVLFRGHIYVSGANPYTGNGPNFIEMIKELPSIPNIGHTVNFPNESFTKMVNKVEWFPSHIEDIDVLVYCN